MHILRPLRFEPTLEANVPLVDATSTAEDIWTSMDCSGDADARWGADLRLPGELSDVLSPLFPAAVAAMLQTGGVEATDVAGDPRR